MTQPVFHALYVVCALWLVVFSVLIRFFLMHVTYSVLCSVYLVFGVVSYCYFYRKYSKCYKASDVW